ncbi:galactitol-1-phosphate 5-dehydrogenase [Telmatobacter sp. DSM 110680]|uniref:Galactitol-1-phosphate 5-dehydrogenase n=1 Tax=Telmatobacter sp. DSM 110680 TaxID=3036704 RepID=A0AAU7DK39_9BACT
MKSLLLKEYGQFVIEEMPRPEPSQQEVLVRVEACGICGSDVHGYDGSSGRRIPPLVMGHEAAGIIVAVGAGVTSYKLGDRVTFDSTVYCGQCVYCRRGEVNLCDRREVIGVSCGEYRRDGAFAEYIAVPERILYRLPSKMSFPEAAMLEATSVALHAVKVSGVKKGDTVLVVGAGMIGLLTMQALRATGVGRVLIADIDETRLTLGELLGADEALRGTGGEIAEAILQRTGGVGADAVFDAVGRAKTVAESIDSVRKGGTVTLIGNIEPEVMIPLQKVVSRQIRIQGTAASAGEYPQAIELISTGRIHVRPMITAVAALEEGPQWFERLHAQEPNLMKVVLTPIDEGR